MSGLFCIHSWLFTGADSTTKTTSSQAVGVLMGNWVTHCLLWQPLLCVVC